jgi:glyoxylase-like metal-dependent hydrolase (beta-lactamase superfamily II)
MRIHTLNCISTCPLGGLLMDGETKDSLRARLTCTCLLVETARGLVLVDTGFGLRDVAAPHSRLSRFFLAMLKPELREEMTALRQVEAMGFDPRDVRDVVLTHLDFDHAGGLDDFPWATVHLLHNEREDAFAQRSWLDRQRYRPQQWGTKARWRVYESGEGEPWFGFDCVRDLEGLPPEILLVPLVGHTLGHAGVAIHGDGPWLLDAGDAYFYHQELSLRQPHCTPGLRAYQVMMEKDRKARLWNQDRLRDLRRGWGREVEIFCSHDPHEFAALSGRAPSVPASRVLPELPAAPARGPVQGPGEIR